MKPFKATLQVQPDATLGLSNIDRPVPFTIRNAIGRELDQLEQQGIFKKVTYREWAAPVVPVPKKNGRFCICEDHKLTVNLYY